MVRPTLLVAEPEPAQALSARKLVLETAKFNVVTAHSGREALELLKKFPNVDGLVVHSSLRDGSVMRLLTELKHTDPRKPIILLMSGVARSRKHADHTLPSDEPEELLDLLRELFGDPR